MITLVNVPGRTSKNEMTANLDRKKNGYKMSNPAKAMLGIEHEGASKLAIGEQDGTLWIKAVETTEPNNAHVSKLNMINKLGVVKMLDNYGNHFTITDEVVDGYHRMEATTVERTDTTDTTDTNTTHTEDVDTEEVTEVEEPMRSFSADEEELEEDFL